MSILTADNLVVEAGGRMLCRNFSCDFAQGEVYGLLGANGAGKTSLMRVLAGLQEPRGGVVRLQGRDMQALSRRGISRILGMLPQEAAVPDASIALDWAMAGRYPHLPRFGRESARDLEIVEQAMCTVGLSDCRHRRVTSMSGGERQRLALAALLSQQPRVYLLDEPTNHLDLGWQIRIMTEIRRIATRGSATVIVVLQDINLAAHFCDHLMLLQHDGQIVFGSAISLIPLFEGTYGHPLRRVEDDLGWALIPA